uniref:Uncharacterized protein n=1 Tax=Ascaris lumbricoides TaxID=6252 RepID=A0A0M3HKA0_ASCLU
MLQFQYHTYRVSARNCNRGKRSLSMVSSIRRRRGLLFLRLLISFCRYSCANNGTCFSH